MSRTMQIIELMIHKMEKNPDRYRMEITSRGLCITDTFPVVFENAELPDYYFHFYEPAEVYEEECNKLFEVFIGGIKA